jgi:hypothetical protein
MGLFIATGNGEDTGAKHVGKRVCNALRISVTGNLGGELVRYPSGRSARANKTDWAANRSLE